MIHSLILILMLSISWAQADVHCLNPDGKPVDWWVIYQLPQTLNQQNTQGQFLYLDATQTTFDLLPDINNAHSPLIQTVQQRPKTDHDFWVFNDDRPKGTINQSPPPPLRTQGKALFNVLKTIPDYQTLIDLKRQQRKHKQLSDEFILELNTRIEALEQQCIDSKQLPILDTLLPSHPSSMSLKTLIKLGKALVSPTPAHAKGIVHMGQKSGFWLNHSFPKYPYKPLSDATGQVNHKQQRFAQHALCMQMDRHQLPQIENTLYQIYPLIFDQSRALMPSSNLKTDVININHLETSQQLPISYFSQTGLMQFDENTLQQGIWAKIIADTFQDDFSVQSWRSTQFKNAPIFHDVMTNNGYRVDNIKHIKVPHPSNLSWSLYPDTAWPVDHAKWGAAKHHPIVCFGDLNRQSSQNKRGGGFWCMKHAMLHRNMTSLIESKT